MIVGPRALAGAALLFAALTAVLVLVGAVHGSLAICCVAVGVATAATAIAWTPVGGERH